MMDPLRTPPLPASTPAPAPVLPVTGGPDAQKTAREFEAVFLGQMMQIMLETTPSDGEFSGGHGEQMFRGVLAEKLGSEIAAQGGIGLAPVVLNQIIELQKASQ